ncbi:transglycosylase [Rheinheimera sp. SA_1]|jgi:hypothetical protein|uniref:transglycosylase SLT domain-containing protein n=1 Tax=Rheinheimera sp. SA_1 TaxID=1827365 RepID=UPI000801323F|nr:transglycosylase SLT domain-containing protein [Rheinheimera sp. SA_1]OBP14278.1 transglycosylase [Rheinheimera sp. SA_1]
MRLLLAVATLMMSTQAFASLDYAAWAKNNRDGSWTRSAETAVANSPLVRLVPKDILYFCPAYPKLHATERRKFWVGLISAMAKPESNFKPQRFYQEKFRDGKGRPVISRGLLQISIESANQQRYGCDIPYPAKLHDPRINLACGVKILSKWVSTDGVIAKHSQARIHKGGSRYWSTLRPKSGHLRAIADFTRKLPFCN